MSFGSTPPFLFHGHFSTQNSMCQTNFSTCRTNWPMPLMEGQSGATPAQHNASIPSNNNNLRKSDWHRPCKR
jgi:hypothetical protein